MCRSQRLLDRVIYLEKQTQLNEMNSLTTHQPINNGVGALPSVAPALPVTSTSVSPVHREIEALRDALTYSQKCLRENQHELRRLFSVEKDLANTRVRHPSFLCLRSTTLILLLVTISKVLLAAAESKISHTTSSAPKSILTLSLDRGNDIRDVKVKVQISSLCDYIPGSTQV